MTNYKKLSGIEYMAGWSIEESEECGFDINWYVCKSKPISRS